MSKEYATLLAQVVPVLALALGLEVRAIVGRMKQRGDTEEPTRPFRSGALLGALGVVLTSLAGIEIRALYLIAGPEEFWSDLVVPSAIAVVFLAPVPGALYVGLRAEEVAPRRAAAFAAAWMAVFAVLLVFEFFSF